ncbi:hypothetical protein BY996DRAFT_6415302 [Phakopsora pachyrhizi]|nr:hypothetical protein BY996DRAFT_6415302 [Phakopsora pachyrhizi]
MPCTNNNPIVKPKLEDSETDDDQLGTVEILSDGSQEMLIGDDQLVNSQEIFNPEYPMTLEQLSVVSEDQITVKYPDDLEENPEIMVRFTPTIPHCSMATLIGLTLRVQLLRSIPERFKVDIKIKEGTHQSENSINKQLNDKERVAAALENNHLLGVVQQCLSTAHLRGRKKATPAEGGGE